jgi:hypothetical protein
MTDQQTPPEPFRAFVASIVETPKPAVDKAEKQYQKERKKLPKRGPKPGKP